MLKRIYILFLFAACFLLQINEASARRGCCSRNGGVCGCACCDGTPLSDKCAPYYPNCNKGTNIAVEKERKKAQSSKNPGQKAYVTKVIDGDTIKARILPSGNVVTVRILGIDCPESHKNQKCIRDGKQGRKGCTLMMHTFQSTAAINSPTVATSTLKLSDGTEMPIETKQTTYGKAKQQGIDATKKTFPESDCDKKCLEAQLDNYHSKCGVDDDTTCKQVVTGYKGDAHKAAAEKAVRERTESIVRNRSDDFDIG